MEKLRKALDQARVDREKLQPTDAPQPSAGATRKEGAIADDPWSSLIRVQPDEALLQRNRVLSSEQTGSSMPFDILRTKIVLQMRKNGWRRLAITSATPVCGKTTITANMALGLARQAEQSAIVLELDLRNPSLAKMLGLEPPRDITSMLSGEVAFDKQAVRVGDRVALSMARGRNSDPTRYLASQRTAEAIDTIEATYAPDLIIFDTPPILVSDDTRALLGRVDCALIVARAEKTTVAQIDSAEREIAEHTNVLGVVLNQLRFTEGESGYGYGYN